MSPNELWDAVRDSSGWIVAGVLALVAIFRDAFKSAAVGTVRFVGSLLYQRLAGSRMLRRRALKRYRRGLQTHTERIQVPFRENRPLVLKRIYVALRIAAQGSAEKPRDAWQVLQEHRRVVVTGPPGAGKSMLLRHLAAEAAEGAQEAPLGRYLPVLLELHRLGRPAQNRGEAVEDYIVDAMARAGFPRAEKFVRTAIAKNWLLLLLDGLDEVPSEERRTVAARLGDFLEQRSDCPVVVTCRSAVYRGEFDAVCEQRVTLEPFEDQQIQAFLESWSDPMPEGKSPAQLMAALREQPQLLGAARNPLLLTIITHLYSDNATYVLPRSRAEFYRQAAGILLEQWHERLGHNRFDGTEKRTVLSAVALQMQAVGVGEQDRRTISQEVALANAATVMPRLGRDQSEAGEILKEIVERSGLLLSIDGGTRYAFAHLTFQEYFAAEALLNRGDELVAQFNRDHDAWREVVILWCGLVADCTGMVEEIHAADGQVALSCVAEGRSVDERVAKTILDPVIRQVIDGDADETVARALGSVAADIRPRGNQVLNTLIGEVGTIEVGRSLTTIASALAASNRTPAAEAIVRRLPDDERLTSSVVRLGDLAVPSLREAAKGRGRRAACACLAAIGTPEAGVALVDALYADKGRNVPAAWGIASVIGSPTVERRVAGHVAGMRLQTSLAWIWKPFAVRGDPAVSALVGFAAELIQGTTAGRDAIAAPDARICVALCGMDPRPLSEPIRIRSGDRRLLADLNARFEEPKFGMDEDDALVVVRGKQASHGVVWSRESGMRISSYGHLLTVMTGLLEARAGGPGLGEEPAAAASTAEEVDAAQEEILKHMGGGDNWKRLVHSMPAGVRRFFLARAKMFGRVSPETWALVTSSGFEIDRSSFYVGALATVLATSAVATARGISLLAAGVGWLEAALIVLCLVAILVTLFRLFRPPLMAPPDPVGRVRMNRLGRAVLWPLVLASELRERLTFYKQLLTRGEQRGDVGRVMLAHAGQEIPGLLFLPAIFWLAGSAIAALAGVLVAIAVLFCLAAAFFGFLYLAVRKEESSRSPLTGVFARGIGAIQA